MFVCVGVIICVCTSMCITSMYVPYLWMGIYVPVCLYQYVRLCILFIHVCMEVSDYLYGAFLRLSQGLKYGCQI